MSLTNQEIQLLEMVSENVGVDSNDFIDFMNENNLGTEDIASMKIVCDHLNVDFADLYNYMVENDVTVQDINNLEYAAESLRLDIYETLELMEENNVDFKLLEALISTSVNKNIPLHEVTLEEASATLGRGALKVSGLKALGRGASRVGKAIADSRVAKAVGRGASSVGKSIADSRVAKAVGRGASSVGKSIADSRVGRGVSKVKKGLADRKDAISKGLSSAYHKLDDKTGRRLSNLKHSYRMGKDFETNEAKRRADAQRRSTYSYQREQRAQSENNPYK